MAVQFWAGVIESELLGTYLPGTGVRDKWLVDTKMDLYHKNGIFVAIISVNDEEEEQINKWNF